MNNLDLQYQELLSDILKNGRKKTDRTGMIIEKKPLPEKHAMVARKNTSGSV